MDASFRTRHGGTMARIQGMRRGVNTFVRTVMGASGVLLVLLCPANASAVECEWNGSVSADWSNGANWNAGCGAGGPVNGDSVVFENGAANAVTNNPTANLQLIGLLMSGVGAGNVPYQIGGSAIVLNGNIAVNTGGLPAPQITAPL